MHRILMGADPEVFLTKNGIVVPCVGIIKGTKKEPYPVPNSKVGLTLQEDNVTLELGWKPTRINKFRTQVNQAQAELRALLKQLDPLYSWKTASGWEFEGKDLQSEQAQEFGCVEDLLAHQQGAARPPVNIADVRFNRFCGGHLHFGYDVKKAIPPRWAIVQFLDIVSVMAAYDGYDRQLSTLRRRYYGLPGLYREKEYGLEYRTPSNYWLYHGISYAEMMGNVVEAVINKPNFARKLWSDIDWDAVQEAVMMEKFVNSFTYDDAHTVYSALINAKVEETDLEDNDKKAKKKEEIYLDAPPQQDDMEFDNVA